MRKNILIAFYVVVSGFILGALSQDFVRASKTLDATTPEYVFTLESEDNSGKRKQEEADIIRQWAEGYDPNTTYN